MTYDPNDSNPFHLPMHPDDVLTFGDLPPTPPYRTLPNGAIVEPRRPILYCSSCGDEASADPGDYWNVRHDRPIICGNCGDPMRLVDKRTVYEDVVLPTKETP